ncbi:MAG: rhomboid family intramembrane serine protease [Algisphaera sp.]
MSWENRDYNRSGGGLGGGGGAMGVTANLPPVTLWLVVVNVVVFLVDNILTGSARGNALSPATLGYFSPEKGLYGFQIWRLVSYQFLHGNGMHLLFNMIGVWVFGGMLERSMGSRRYLAFYLLGGVGGALLFAASSWVPSVASVASSSRLIGASACVFACVVGCMMRFPKQSIGMMFIPVTFTIFALGAFYLAFDLLQVLAGGGGAGTAVAHLGGALAGYGIMRYPASIAWADHVSTGDLRQRVETQKRTSKVKKAAVSDAEIDRILSKVSEKGLQSLTAKEKKALNRETDRKRG